MFGFGRRKISAELLARNLTCPMIDADDCWAQVCRLRGYALPGPIATGEVAFARAALVQDKLGKSDEPLATRMRVSSNLALLDSFDGQDTDETLAYYHDELRIVVPIRLAWYAEAAISSAGLAGALGVALGVPGPPAIEGAEEFDRVASRIDALLAKVSSI